ncbi:glutamate ligase domain-containing protein, partial [Gloeocapsopsis crepidinum]
NPAAAQVLRQFVDTFAVDSVSWVMGMLSTKDHSEIFEALLRSHDRLLLVPVPDHSSADPEQLARLAQKICPQLSECSTYTDVESALTSAIATSDKLIVLCGSLYLVGHFLSSLATNH